jgi:hypothetical protein
MKTVLTVILIALATTVAQAQGVLSNWQNSRSTIMRFTDKVIQALHEGQEYTLRVNVNQDQFGWRDTLLVTYKADPAHQEFARSQIIVEGDIIDIRGRPLGFKNYTAVLGQNISLPYMEACDIYVHGSGPKFVSPGGTCF